MQNHDRRPTKKELRLLAVLDIKQELSFSNLPVGIGTATIRNLLAAGLIEPVENGFGIYSKRARWRRRRPN